MLEEREKYYHRIWPKWTLQEHINNGSNGTSVYKITRTCPYWQDGSQEEVCALKIIPIIEDSIFTSPDYETKKGRSCQEVGKEVWNMHQVRGCTNVVTFSDYEFVQWKGKTKQGVFLAIRMDYLETLYEVARKESLREKQILNVGIDICRALVQCHAKQIVHRDIKPQNIFRTSGGVYVLGDFGIAKMIDIQNENQCNTNRGSALYAAPEQFYTNYGLGVDIYSLGLVLYELLNGNVRPFEDGCSTAYEENLKRLKKGCVLPALKNVRTSWNNILRKACAYDPSKRYATARDFLNALEDLRKEINNDKGGKKDSPSPEKKEDNCEAVSVESDHIKSLVKLAKEGDPKAQYELAHWCYEGKYYGVKKDHTMSFRLCRDAAKQGYIPAQVRMGIFYYKGVCTEQDYKKAFVWFNKGVKNMPTNQEERREVGKAQYYLSLFYKNGFGVVEKNLKYANKLCEQAKANGYYET